MQRWVLVIVATCTLFVLWANYQDSNRVMCDVKEVGFLDDFWLSMVRYHRSGTEEVVVKRFLGEFHTYRFTNGRLVAGMIGSTLRGSGFSKEEVEEASLLLEEGRKVFAIKIPANCSAK